jgi:hypothetical protein
MQRAVSEPRVPPGARYIARELHPTTGASPLGHSGCRYPHLLRSELSRLRISIVRMRSAQSGRTASKRAGRPPKVLPSIPNIQRASE